MWARPVLTLILAVGSASILQGCGGASSAAGSPSSSVPTIVLVPPVIILQPANQTVNLGQAARFAVAATGSDLLAYQWRRNGIAIPGATEAAYSTPALAGSDSGSQFTVVVSNSAGQVTSAAATVTISNPLSVGRQFVSQGTILDFGPLVLGNTRTQILVLTNTDTVPLEISNVQVTGSFDLQMNVPLILMPAQSTPVPVTFAPAAIGEAYGNITIQGDIAFAVGLDGTGTTSHYSMLTWNAGENNMTYNVYRGTEPAGPYEKINVFPVFGSTAFVDPNPVAGTTYYYGITAVNDSLGESVLSESVTVVVPISAADRSTITGQPTNQSVLPGGTATFTVTAIGTGLSYQWLRNGVLIPGATGPSYTIPAVSPDDYGASFLVLVNSGAGTATSSSAVLTVTAAPGPPGADTASH